MPRIDGHMQHLSLDLARPDERLDGVLQRFNPLPTWTTDINNGNAILRRQFQLQRQIRLVADNNSFFFGKFGKIIPIRRGQRFTDIEHVQDEFRLRERCAAAADTLALNLIARLAQPGFHVDRPGCRGRGRLDFHTRIEQRFSVIRDHLL